MYIYIIGIFFRSVDRYKSVEKLDFCIKSVCNIWKMCCSPCKVIQLKLNLNTVLMKCFNKHSVAYAWRKLCVFLFWILRQSKRKLRRYIHAELSKMVTVVGVSNTLSNWSASSLTARKSGYVCCFLS